jgi:hypothetical protein
MIPKDKIKVKLYYISSINANDSSCNALFINFIRFIYKFKQQLYNYNQSIRFLKVSTVLQNSLFWYGHVWKFGHVVMFNYNFSLICFLRISCCTFFPVNDYYIIIRFIHPFLTENVRENYYL